MENIKRMRNENIFSTIWKDILQLAEKIGVELPVLKRQKVPPKKYEYTTVNTTHSFSSPEELYRKTYFQVIDTATQSLQSRFESETMSLLNTIENFITGSADVDVSVITNFYNTNSKGSLNQEIEFDGQRLKSERDLLILTIREDDNFKLYLQKLIKEKSTQSEKSKEKISADRKYISENTNLNQKNTKLKLKDIVTYLKYKPEVKPIFSQVTKLVKLILTVPASSCANECSFSALKRLKNYLRSTMSQDRLNNTSTLHVYSDLTDDLNIDRLLDEFILKNNLRQQTFSLSKNI